MLMEPISASNTPVKHDMPKPVKTSEVIQPKASRSSKTQASTFAEPVLTTHRGMDSGIEGVSGEEELKVATEKQIKQAMERVNKAVVGDRTKCAFSYHEGTKTVSIKIINEETDEVIKEIPPEKSLEMLQKMWELSGMFVDEKR